MKTKLHLILATLFCVGSSIAEEIPAVPAEVVSGAKANTKETTNQDTNNIRITAGRNEIVAISQGYTNRIVTPFKQPEIISTSLTGMDKDGNCGEICIKGSVIYVSTDKDYPVSMFITEKGIQGSAVSLTLVPKKVPPRELFVSFAEGSENTFISQNGSKQAEKWETSQSYLDTIKNILRHIALNQVPNGYTMHKTTNNIKIPVCRSKEIKTTFINPGQFLMGYNLNVFIGVAENVSNQTIQINETMCGDWDTAAVAAYPNTVLEPGQKTEIYVVKKISHEEPMATFRPNLLR